jgi:hypothetical protein
VKTLSLSEDAHEIVVGYSTCVDVSEVFQVQDGMNYVWCVDDALKTCVITPDCEAGSALDPRCSFRSPIPIAIIHFWIVLYMSGQRSVTHRIYRECRSLEYLYSPGIFTVDSDRFMHQSGNFVKFHVIKIFTIFPDDKSHPT